MCVVHGCGDNTDTACIAVEFARRAKGRREMGQVQRKCACGGCLDREVGMIVFRLYTLGRLSSY